MGFNCLFVVVLLWVDFSCLLFGCLVVVVLLHLRGLSLLHCFVVGGLLGLFVMVGFVCFGCVLLFGLFYLGWLGLC